MQDKNKILDRFFKLYREYGSAYENVLIKQYGQDYINSPEYFRDIQILPEKKFYKPVLSICQKIELGIKDLINSKRFKEIVSAIPGPGKEREELINDLASHLSLHPKTADWNKKRGLLEDIGLSCLPKFKDKFLFISKLIDFYHFGLPSQFVDIIQCCANSNDPVLIMGESGTGKEMLAKIIHVLSDRRSQPYEAINCNAIPGNLFESELFGYKQGAFTGANKDKEGLLKTAGAGTVLLDEIGDLKIPHQIKLLRVLQEENFFPVGARKTEPLKARLIFATNQPLLKLKEEGEFREDFYQRINTFIIKMPTAREILSGRNGEGTIKWFLYKILKEYENPGMKYNLTNKAMQKLMNYDYPGNFRELTKIFKRAVGLRHNRPALKIPNSDDSIFEISENDIIFDEEYENQSDESTMKKENAKISIDVKSMTMEEVEALCNNYSSKLIKVKAEEILVRNKGIIEKCATEVEHKNKGKKAAGQYFKNTYCKPYNLNWKDYR